MDRVVTFVSRRCKSYASLGKGPDGLALLALVLASLCLPTQLPPLILVGAYRSVAPSMTAGDFG